MGVLKIPLIILVFCTTVFSRDNLDSIPAYKFGLKLSARFGAYRDLKTIIDYTTFVPALVINKRCGNFFELEPLNLLANETRIGKHYSGDSLNFYQTRRVSYVPKVRLMYKVYVNKGQRIFIGMTHAFRYSHEWRTNYNFNITDIDTYTYAFGIDVEYQKNISKRLSLFFFI